VVDFLKNRYRHNDAFKGITGIHDTLFDPFGECVILNPSAAAASWIYDTRGKEAGIQRARDEIL